jgi:hypothetical protein
MMYAHTYEKGSVVASALKPCEWKAATVALASRAACAAVRHFARTQQKQSPPQRIIWNPQNPKEKPSCAQTKPCQSPGARYWLRARSSTFFLSQTISLNSKDKPPAPSPPPKHQAQRRKQTPHEHRPPPHTSDLSFSRTSGHVSAASLKMLITIDAGSPRS